ncbi:DUF2200 family protein [uncultured Pseudokineococcus sp.]|uniref:DUF2200 family protein n=1 Tax=uncultured Pseudokineococcus sp. TaxID=1642928 RepID=UPI0026358900|nr:DUF2200 family protein [uncultured Pseudokineococcus sp.]
MAGHRVFRTPLASIHPHHVAKAEREGRSRADVDLVVCWLTGYDAAGRAGLDSPTTTDGAAPDHVPATP